VETRERFARGGKKKVLELIGKATKEETLSSPLKGGVIAEPAEEKKKEG